MPEVPLAAGAGGPLGVRAEVRDGLEHVLDARALPGVPEALDGDPVPRVQAVFAAPAVVPPAEPGEQAEEAAAEGRDVAAIAGIKPEPRRSPGR